MAAYPRAHHAGEVPMEGVHLADERNTRQGEPIVLQLPMRLEAALGGRGRKSQDSAKRQRPGRACRRPGSIELRQPR